MKCPNCGNDAPAGQAYCNICGSACDATAAAGAAAGEARPGEAGAATDDAIAWQIDVSLFGNPVLRRSLLNAVLLTAGISAVLLGGIVGFASGELVTGLVTAAIAVGATFVLLGLGTLGFLVLVGSKQPFAYRLDREGLVMLNASRASKNINRAALIAGVLTGRPVGIAAGVSGIANEARACAWANVKKVSDRPAERTLIVRGGPLSTLQVFCTPENYAQIRAYVMDRTRHAERG